MDVALFLLGTLHCVYAVCLLYYVLSTVATLYWSAAQLSLLFQNKEISLLRSFTPPASSEDRFDEMHADS